MKLLDLLQAERAKILAAIQAELAGGETFEAIAVRVQHFLSGVAQAAAESAESCSTIAFVAKEASIVGDSPSMTLLRSRIGQLAGRSRASVLIVGERGVGKRHCARVLHHSTYPDGQWFELQAQSATSELDACLALLRRPASLEAELGMTVYVHELGEMSAEIQAQLLRILDEQNLPLRVVASSAQPLSELARSAKLRKDLPLRFSNELKLPTLSHRKEDIAGLTRHFAALVGRRTGMCAASFSEEALGQLAEHSWPGNVDELRQVIERLAADSASGVLDAVDLPTLGDRPSGIAFKLPPSGIEFAELERELLTQALALAANNQTRAASLLGLSRDQIRYRMAKFELLVLNTRTA